MSDDLSALAAPDRRWRVRIEVNNKPVKIDGPRASGLQVKRAAVSQGVSIELEFHLSVVRQDGTEDPVGDDEFVEVHDGTQFFAVDGDDNS